MGKILVGLDKTNPNFYIVHLETNEGAKFTFKCDDESFHGFIETLKSQKHIAEMNRKRTYNFELEKWK